MIQARSFLEYFSGAICQSASTGGVINRLTANRLAVSIIPPGLDRDLWYPVPKIRRAETGSTFLYVGGAYGIRGFYLVLESLKKTTDTEIRLRILARGADQEQLATIRSVVEKYGLTKRVDLIGGWLGAEQLRREMQSATAVLMPFVLVPSELPVSVMESISCGTPVVVSSIDGLPDAAGEAGIIVPQADATAVASAMRSLHSDRDLLDRLNDACLTRSLEMKSWEEVAGLWEKVLEG
jgi:glycosyltransferase involved in cell wall biosynthesis